MAGYSKTPLPKKLGIKPENHVALLKAPREFTDTLGTLPSGVRVRKSLGGDTEFDVIVLFCKQRAVLDETFEACVSWLAERGGLWIAWPKKASGVKTDMVEDTVREVALPAGLVDNKVCAIDEVWSGLRVVRRRVTQRRS